MPIRQRNLAKETFPPLTTIIVDNGVTLRFTMIRYGMNYSQSTFFMEIRKEIMSADLTTSYADEVVIVEKENAPAVVEETYTVEELTGEITVTDTTLITPAANYATLIKDTPVGNQSIEAFLSPIIIQMFNDYIATL